MNINLIVTVLVIVLIRDPDRRAVMAKRNPAGVSGGVVVLGGITLRPRQRDLVPRDSLGETQASQDAEGLAPANVAIAHAAASGQVATFKSEWAKGETVALCGSLKLGARHVACHVSLQVVKQQSAPLPTKKSIAHLVAKVTSLLYKSAKNSYLLQCGNQLAQILRGATICPFEEQG